MLLPFRRAQLHDKVLALPLAQALGEGYAPSSLCFALNSLFALNQHCYFCTGTCLTLTLHLPKEALQRQRINSTGLTRTGTARPSTCPAGPSPPSRPSLSASTRLEGRQRRGGRRLRSTSPRLRRCGEAVRGGGHRLCRQGACWTGSHRAMSAGAEPRKKRSRQQ